MEKSRKIAGGKSGSSAKADPFGHPESTLANADPFGDLLSFTPNQPSSSNSARGNSVSRPKPPPVAMTADGTLAAEKRRSQESRQKRDTFLNQMSSFLEGIESSTTAIVVPPESYTAVPFPPPADNTPSTSVFPESTSSLMKEDDLFGDPFVRTEIPTSVAKPHGFGGAIPDSTNSMSHPRGSLFDDDIGVEEKQQVETFPRPVVTSDSAAPPRRVTPSPLPFSEPSHDVRESSQGRQKNKTKPTRGLDLEEVRKRTSLLSGESRAPVPTTSREAAAAPRPAVPSSYFDASWGRQHAPQPPSEVPHPLHAAATSPRMEAEGNYFNEEFLRAREHEGREGGRVMEQAPRRGDRLMDSAGSFLTSARDGAKTLLQDAKAGVDAVGASWQGPREDTGHQRFGPPVTPSQGLPQKETAGEREFDVTFGEGRFGFTLFREDAGPRKGQGVVCKVHTGSTAHTLGVQVGDMVTCVNKNRYDTYDEVMKVLPKLPRPVLISFLRPRVGQFVEGNHAGAVRRSSAPSEGGGGNPLEWLARLNPFEKRKPEEEGGVFRERRTSAGSMMSTSQEFGSPGEVFARGLRGGVFSWSYYGTSDGIEANTKDTYTEHVMRVQWGRTADTMTSWMVARRYREFDALDLDLRDAYPDRREALPRLPPKEFFKLAPDVVERRTKGLEMYMTTLIRRFPDMLEASHLDRFLTISERLSALQSTSPESNSQTLSYRNLGANGSSSNVFPLSEEPSMDSMVVESLVGADILNLMSSAEAWRLSKSRNSSPVDVAFCEDLVDELSSYISRIPPEAHLLQDETLCRLVARCQKAWPGLKAAAGKMMSEDACGTLLPRIVQCDENLELAFGSLRALLASRGYATR